LLLLLRGRGGEIQEGREREERREEKKEEGTMGRNGPPLFGSSLRPWVLVNNPASQYVSLGIDRTSVYTSSY